MFKAGLRIGPDIGVNMTDMGTDVFPTPDTTLTDRCSQRVTPQAREGTKQSSVGFYRFPKAIQVLIANETSCAPSSLLTVNPWPSLADTCLYWPTLTDIGWHGPTSPDIGRCRATLPNLRSPARGPNPPPVDRWLSLADNG